VERWYQLAGAEFRSVQGRLFGLRTQVIGTSREEKEFYFILFAE